MKKIYILIPLVAFSAILLNCSSGPAAKDTVFQFIDAVKNSDSLQVVKLLDIDAYIRSKMPSMTPEDSAKVLKEYRITTIQSLLGDGDVRYRFLHDQIVVNMETRKDSVAEVEVSFIDRDIGNQLYTKMQLHLQPDHTWRITFFK